MAVPYLEHFLDSKSSNVVIIIVIIIIIVIVIIIDIKYCFN